MCYVKTKLRWTVDSVSVLKKVAQKILNISLIYIYYYIILHIMRRDSLLRLWLDLYLLLYYITYHAP